MKRIAVFCGSSNGASDLYIQGARDLGKELAKRNISLVYGGASVGVMGAVADAVLEAGGHVIGVMPTFLEEREISHKNLSELIVVESMHDRKAKMAELVDGFITLPGGPGTLEEFFEMNINDYYTPLISLFNHMTEEQFLQEKYRSMALVDTKPQGLLDQFNTYQPPSVKTYITKAQS